MTEDSVGYRRPPKNTRFGPGQSGNPRGRPKRVPTLFDDLRAELVRQLPPERPGGHRLTVQRLVAKVLTAKAMKGDLRAVAMLLALSDQLWSEGQGTDPSGQDEVGEVFSEAAQKILAIELRKEVDDEKQ